jgi:CheY-like chemotaxis protein
MTEADKTVSILLVEDNPDHAELTLKALKNGATAQQVYWVKDGQEALDFLQQRGRFTDTSAAPRPGLVLLDVNLPDLDGFSVARRLTNGGGGPVVVLVSSRDSSDFGPLVMRSGARGFVPKAELSGDRLQELL